ncbi:prolyl oligopeptidase family serine peptidase [Paractinoplanes atraurantiacus]|uniref:Prolyl oligopeptidase family protein n=1 Tax=Paractinoplanes atraurantiacus TaxID=1036182 RepID=A0A285GM26_9ACTN|nr:prolyl oligopeptidase family serine peptidase [Actinoplanes atraurantiacus]SNY24670.1 Prolyl oligopeptidase family protein [Actinoplanes atraurantiacus]
MAQRLLDVLARQLDERLAAAAVAAGQMDERERQRIALAVETVDALDPAVVARRLPSRTPVLLTCGTADPRVPCPATTTLAAALRRAHATGPGRVVVTGVAHDLTDPANPEGLAPAASDALRLLLRQGRQ